MYGILNVQSFINFDIINLFLFFFIVSFSLVNDNFHSQSSHKWLNQNLTLLNLNSTSSQSLSTLRSLGHRFTNYSIMLWWLFPFTFLDTIQKCKNAARWSWMVCFHVGRILLSILHFNYRAQRLPITKVCRRIHVSAISSSSDDKVAIVSWLFLLITC